MPRIGTNMISLVLAADTGNLGCYLLALSALPERVRTTQEYQVFYDRADCGARNDGSTAA